VINYNYARYIGETLRSILAQTYPWNECLVVDNGSTDNSLDVIRDHIVDDPRFSLIELDRNYGQLGAALKILDRLKGEFVCFVDADDVLFPNFVASHVQAHLALPDTVSLTSSNIVEVDAEGKLMAGALPWLVRSGGRNGFRKERGIPELPMLTADERRQLAEACHTFDWNQRQWLWAPGTSNMYRRSMINFLLPHGFDGPLGGGVDCFLNYFGHALTGSCVIDIPLSAYRIHGSNDHSRRPCLSGVYTGLPRNILVDNEISTRVGGMLLQRAESIGFAVGAERFWQMLDVIGARPFRSMADYHRSLIPAFIEHHPQLIQQFGASSVADAMRFRIGVREFPRLWRAIHPDRHPAEVARSILAIEWRNRRARLSRFSRLRDRARQLLALMRLGHTRPAAQVSP
jgi:glycosyltransferase involved in cell wall biosynthesis